MLDRNHTHTNSQNEIVSAWRGKKCHIFSAQIEIGRRTLTLRSHKIYSPTVCLPFVEHFFLQHFCALPSVAFLFSSLTLRTAFRASVYLCVKIKYIWKKFWIINTHDVLWMWLGGRMAGRSTAAFCHHFCCCYCFFSSLSFCFVPFQTKILVVFHLFAGCFFFLFTASAVVFVHFSCFVSSVARAYKHIK